MRLWGVTTNAQTITDDLSEERDSEALFYFCKEAASIHPAGSGIWPLVWASSSIRKRVSLLVPCLNEYCWPLREYSSSIE